MAGSIPALNLSRKYITLSLPDVYVLLYPIYFEL